MPATIDTFDFIPSQSAEVDRLRRIKATTRDAAEQLLRDHGDADGNLPAQHQREFDRLMTEWDTKGAPLGRRLTIEAMNGGKSMADINHAIRHGIDPNTRMGDSGGLGGSRGKLNGRCFDDNGRPTRGLARDESFSAALSEHHRITGEGGRGQKFVDDGFTIGSYCRMLALGPANSLERAALSGSEAEGAGFAVPEFLAGEVIDALRAKLVLLRAGAQTIPIMGSTSFARIVTDPTPAWRQEGTPVAESEPTFGAINVEGRSLACTVRATRELLQDAANMDQVIRRSLAQAFAQQVDAKGLFGMGAAAEPLGIVNWDGINTVASIGVVADYSEILDANKLIMDDNSEEPTALVMSNREWTSYAKFEDSTGQPLMRPKAIEDLPFLASSSVPTNEGGGANESTMILANYRDFMLCFRAELTIDLLKEFYSQTYEYGFLANLRMDTLLMHSGSVCTLSGITP